MTRIRKKGSSPNYSLKISVLLLIAFVVSGFLSVQSNNFNDDDRAKYICGFIRQITWHNKETKLTIGILESNTAFSDELRRNAIPENLRDKTLTVISLNSLENLPKLHLLYVNKIWNPDAQIDSLMAVAKTKGFLLITESALFRESMINFVVINGQTYYELNEQALQNAGFTYMSVLPFAAVKTIEDWEALFKETKQELDELKLDYEQLKKEIELQKKIIAAQEKTISENAAEIALMAEEIKRGQEQINIQLAQLKKLSNDISATKKELGKYCTEVEQQMKIIEEKQNLIEDQARINEQYSKEIEEKMAQIGNLNTKINEYLATLRMQNVIIILGALLVIFLAAFGIYEYRNYKQKQRINQVLEKQNKQIREQRDQIAQQNREITDSILSAYRIQSAILPTRKSIKEFVDMFIFYRPRDIVSGDFYWTSKKDDKLIIVVADCTGHGVPGAFMSMLGIAFLNEIVNKENEVYANEILNKLREHVINSLNQAGLSIEEEHTKDGMDIALCVIDYPSMTLQYAGAYNPLLLVRNKQLTEIKADKMPVAYSDFHGNKVFTNNLVPLIPNDCIYMFSDGYADQFGGSQEKVKKFSTKRLKNTLLEISNLPLNEQEKFIEKYHDEWKGNNFQVDDVLLVGIRI